MYKLSIGNLKLPPVYVCQSKAEARRANETGLPYIIWRHSEELLVRLLMYPALERLFPHVRWDQVWGIRDLRRKAATARSIVVRVSGGEGGAVQCDGIEYNVTDIAEDNRYVEGSTGYKPEAVTDVAFEDYLNGACGRVNVEQLMELKLLPTFMHDITECVKKNLADLHWRDGYNRKLGVPLGTYDPTPEQRNLLILDISHSIPLGIAHTMLTLLDTLRERNTCDVIITSARSGFYRYEDELPSPQELRRLYGRAQESDEFEEILRTLPTRRYGHVISFGDDDSPGRVWVYDHTRYNSPEREEAIQRPEVYWSKMLPHFECEHIWHYHTGKWYGATAQRRTGYAKWCHILCPSAEEHYDTSWVESIEEDDDYEW